LGGEEVRRKGGMGAGGLAREAEATRVRRRDASVLMAERKVLTEIVASGGAVLEAIQRAVWRAVANGVVVL